MQEPGRDMCGCARLRGVWQNRRLLAHSWLETGKRQIGWQGCGKWSLTGSGGEGERLTGTEAAFVTEARAFPAEGAVGVDSWDDVNLALRSHT